MNRILYKDETIEAHKSSLKAIMTEPPMDAKTHRRIMAKRVESRRLAEDARRLRYDLSK